MTVAELLERISSREMTEWMAFAELEPFGSRANYIGHAITSQTVANVNRSKGTRPYKVEDFMPNFEGKSQSVDEMLQLAQMLTVGLGGSDMRDLGKDDPDSRGE